LHSIFQDDESLGWEEEVEVVGLEEDLDAVGHEGTSDGGRQDSAKEEDEEEEEHEDDAGLYNDGVTGLLQDLHPHANLGVATLFVLLAMGESLVLLCCVLIENLI
jgi:hypothetical protein